MTYYATNDASYREGQSGVEVARNQLDQLLAESRLYTQSQDYKD